MYGSFDSERFFVFKFPSKVSFGDFFATSNIRNDPLQMFLNFPRMTSANMLINVYLPTLSSEIVYRKRRHLNFEDEGEKKLEWNLTNRGSE